MAPSFSSAAQSNQPKPQLGADRKRQKYRSMKEIMKVAKRVVVVENEESDDGDYYTRVACDQCCSGERDEELLLCDKCDKGYHMLCLRPIMVRVPIGPWFCPACSDDQDPPLKSFTQKKIIDFFRIQKCRELMEKYAWPQDVKKRRRRSGTLVFHKKRRRILPHVPS
ncbi:Histone-lysine N-methyltransferase ATXR5 [Abeliophyllum distichum]|uniref:Histone-lysine N-methyltransferase ATXR5 n=1 Tax=Abeliophyllum distichum TaxID=126358 RepID=A0ABD1SD83_9LAMI